MNRLTYPFAAAAFAGLTLASAPHPALAQGAIVVTPGPDEDFTFAPEDDGMLHDYVVRRAPPTHIYEEDTTFRVGSSVPTDVELSPMANIGKGRFSRLAYFDAAGGKVVVVDPATRRVVRILSR